MLGSTNSPRAQDGSSASSEAAKELAKNVPVIAAALSGTPTEAGAIAVGAAASEAVSGSLDDFFPQPPADQGEEKASGDPGQQLKTILKVFKRTEKGAWERVRAVAKMAEEGDESVRKLAEALKPWKWGKSKISEMTLVAKDFPPEVVLHDLSIDFHANVRRSYIRITELAKKFEQPMPEFQPKEWLEVARQSALKSRNHLLLTLATKFASAPVFDAAIKLLEKKKKPITVPALKKLEHARPFFVLNLDLADEDMLERGELKCRTVVVADDEGDALKQLKVVAHKNGGAMNVSEIGYMTLPRGVYGLVQMHLNNPANRGKLLSAAEAIELSAASWTVEKPEPKLEQPTIEDQAQGGDQPPNVSQATATP